MQPPPTTEMCPGRYAQCVEAGHCLYHYFHIPGPDGWTGWSRDEREASREASRVLAQVLRDGRR